MLKILPQTYVSKATGWVQGSLCLLTIILRKHRPNTSKAASANIDQSIFQKRRKRCPLKISYLKSNYILLIAFINVQNFFLHNSLYEPNFFYCEFILMVLKVLLQENQVYGQGSKASSYCWIFNSLWGTKNKKQNQNQHEENCIVFFINFFCNWPQKWKDAGKYVYKNKETELGWCVWYCYKFTFYISRGWKYSKVILR